MVISSAAGSKFMSVKPKSKTKAGNRAVTIPGADEVKLEDSYDGDVKRSFSTINFFGSEAGYASKKLRQSDENFFSIPSPPEFYINDRGIITAVGRFSPLIDFDGMGSEFLTTEGSLSFEEKSAKMIQYRISQLVLEFPPLKAILAAPENEAFDSPIYKKIIDLNRSWPAAGSTDTSALSTTEAVHISAILPSYLSIRLKKIALGILDHSLDTKKYGKSFAIENMVDVSSPLYLIKSGIYVTWVQFALSQGKADYHILTGLIGNSPSNIINYVNGLKLTALHIVIAMDRGVGMDVESSKLMIKLLNSLVSNFANVNLTANVWLSPALYAVYHGYRNAAIHLLNRKLVNPNLSSSCGRISFTGAALKNSDYEILDKIIALPNFKQKEPFLKELEDILAMRHPSVEGVFQKMLKFPNLQKFINSELVFYIVKKNRADYLEILVKSGCSLNELYEDEMVDFVSDEWTLLHVAVLHQSTHCVRFLARRPEVSIDADASITTPRYDSADNQIVISPLYLALNLNYFNIAISLISCRARIGINQAILMAIDFSLSELFVTIWTLVQNFPKNYMNFFRKVVPLIIEKDKAPLLHIVLINSNTLPDELQTELYIFIIDFMQKETIGSACKQLIELHFKKDRH